NTMALFDPTETLLKKAELEMTLRSFPAAIATLSQVLQIQPKSYTALLNRALAEIQVKQFLAAKDDLKAMGILLPDQAYLAEFYLADVAAAENNKSDEMDHLERCLRFAPKEGVE